MADPRGLILTFDDGPGPDTVELAEYLAEEKIQATFFAVGRHVRQSPDAIARILAQGHLLGNHTENHLHLTDSSVADDDALAEFLQTDAVLRQFQVPAPTYFRAPYGAWNGHLQHLFDGHRDISMAGGAPVHWDVYAGDYTFWRNQRSPEDCAQAYLDAIRKKTRRGIVLFHDYCADDALTASRNRTCAMMRLLIPRLREAGYGFGSLDDTSGNVGFL